MRFSANTFFGCALLVSCLFRADSVRAETLTFQASPWRSHCPANGACTLPRPVAQPKTVTIELPTPNPGEAAHVERELSWTEAQAASARLRIFSVHPQADTGLPRYYQLQLEITAPARAFCAFSPRADWGTLPPLICAADEARAPGEGHERWGITWVQVK